jgi:hypothetical protein
MRRFHFLLALALVSCSIEALAADVDFEVDAKVFEPAEAKPPRFEIEGRPRSYDHPLYEGLWRMTLAAFGRSDVEIFTFNIASNNEDLCRCLTTISYPFFPAHDSPLFDGLWPMTREAFQALDEENWSETPPGMVIAQSR